MRYFLLALLLLLLAVGGCNVARDTKDEAVSSGEGAVGIAEKMSGGTVGEVNEDTGEPADADDDVENMANEISGD
jgi:hypothetical protein